MSGAVALYDLLQPVAFVGMKGDSMEDNVDTHPAAGDIPFGRVCIRLTPTGTIKVVLAGAPGNGPAVGVSLHDHLHGAYGTIFGAAAPGYREFDAVSVLTRGRVWAELAPSAVATNVAEGSAVSYIPTAGADAGKVTGAAAGNTLLLNAVFRSGVVVCPPIWPSNTLGGSRIALVELHYPLNTVQLP